MDPLEEVRLLPLMERFRGKIEIGVGLIDGPVAMDHPDLAGGNIREVPAKLSGACGLAESAACTHYFFCNSRNYQMDDADFNRLFATGLRAAFEREDKPMIEAQQRRVGMVDLLDQHPALLGIDAASVRVRKILSQMIKAEASTAASV